MAFRCKERRICWFVLVLALRTPAGAQDPDYGDYHQQVIQAETLLAQEAFADALQAYDGLVESFVFVFRREYQIATQLAWHLGERDEAFRYLELGIKAGWSKKSIKKNTFLHPMLEQSEWKSIRSHISSWESAYQKGLDQDLRKEAKKMINKDQRKALGAAIGNIFTFSEEAQARKYEKFAPHSEEQMAKLTKMLDGPGYPGEKLIGDDVWMSVVLSHHNSISQNYNSKDKVYPALRPRLLEAIRKGEMAPHEFATADNWYVAVKSDRKERSYGFLESLREEDLDRANQLRAAIGMRSVELRNQLVDLQAKTGMSFYLPGGPWVEGKIEIVTE